MKGSVDFTWICERDTSWHAIGKWPLADVTLELATPVKRGLILLDFGDKVTSSVTAALHARPSDIAQLADGFAESPGTLTTRFGPLSTFITEIRSDGTMLLWFFRDQAEALMRRCVPLSPPLMKETT